MLAVRRLPAAAWLGLAIGCTQAQTAAPSAAPIAPIGFHSVAEALGSLQARDGNGTIVVHSDGWTIVNDPLAAAQWSFTPATHAAYPAVVRRIVRRTGSDASVDTQTLCEAPKDACTSLLAEFEAMNGRITQAVRARDRQGSSLAQPRPQ